MPPNDFKQTFEKYAKAAVETFRQFVPLPFTSVTVVKTITVAGRTQEKAKENLQLVLSNLKKPIKYFLECDGPLRPLNMGSMYLIQNPFFAMLLRFYVFSSATGADHIF